MLDEKALRKPGFRPDVPVRLADGQEWFLPKPRIKTGRRLRPDGTRKVGRISESGPEYDRLLDELYASEGEAFLQAQFDLAAMLLRQNYALTEDDIDSILILDMRAEGVSPEDLATRTIVQNTIQGVFPLATAPGDDPD